MFKSIILRPPRFLSPMMVDLFIFAGFPSQLKLTINFSISLSKFSGLTRTDELQISLESPNVFSNVYFSVKCEAHLFQQFSVYFKFLSFSKKFNSFALFKS